MARAGRNMERWARMGAMQFALRHLIELETLVCDNDAICAFVRSLSTLQQCGGGVGDEAREAVEDEGGYVGRHGLGGETRVQDAREMEDKLNVWVEIGGTWHGGKGTNVVGIALSSMCSMSMPKSQSPVCRIPRLNTKERMVVVRRMDKTCRVQKTGSVV